MSKVYQKIATCLQAMENCRKLGNDEWLCKHYDTITDLVHNKMPSGSGWDLGTRLGFDDSTPEKLRFYGGFHHMDEHGGHDGWTDHSITVTPSLVHEIKIDVGGQDRDDINDYLHQLFYDALLSEADA
jgi:hypothetical protein